MLDRTFCLSTQKTGLLTDAEQIQGKLTIEAIDKINQENLWKKHGSVISSEGKKSDAWVEDRNSNEMHFTKRRKQSIRNKSEANFK